MSLLHIGLSEFWTLDLNVARFVVVVTQLDLFCTLLFENFYFGFATGTAPGTVAGTNLVSPVDLMCSKW